jgi:Protein of unknown function (DUF3822)
LLTLAQIVKKEFKLNSKNEHSGNLGMALHIQKHCIDVAIFDINNTQIVLVGNYAAQNGMVDGDFLSSVLKQFIVYQCKKYVAAIDEKRFLLVPNIFDSTEKMQDLFSTHHFVEANEAILEQSLPWQNFTALYGAKQGTMQLLHHLMPNVQLMHAQICNLQEYLANNTSNAIYLHSTTQFFTLTVITNKLMLHNAYENNSDTDIILQIQKAVEVYQLLQPSIFVSGYNAADVLSSVQKYFVQAISTPLPKSILYLTTLDKESHKQFHSLYNIVKACAS